MKPAKPPTFDVTTVFTDVCSPSIIIKPKIKLIRSPRKSTYVITRIQLYYRLKSVQIYVVMVWIFVVQDNISYQ